MLKIENLYKNYGAHEVLKGINLEINNGEVLSIVGPSGSGKSTILRSINMLEIPTSGKIYIDGQEINSDFSNLNTQREKIGMVFQNFNLFPHLSVLENIILAPQKLKKISKEEAITTAENLLKKVNVYEKINSMPSQLSGGQKQRVAIARALAMHPSYMLFDEPTSALDPEMVKEVLEVIQNLSKEITSVIVSHEMSFVKKISTNVVFLDNGKILEQGKPEEIFENSKNERIKDFFKKL